MNFGTINAESGANAATSTEAIAETPQSNPSANNANRNVYFANETGGVVNGNVVMGNGNDTVELFSGSTINGNLSGGPTPYAGNRDTLALDAATAPGTLNGTLTDFDILTKTGTFAWEITGALSSNRTLAAEVQQGTLVLSGNTPTLSGTMIVDSGATLQIGNGGATGSFGANITDNGIVAFDRSDSPGLTYSNVISGAGQVQQIGGGTTTLTGTNTYSGGTFFNNGTLAASADSNLGATTGGLTFNGGTFQYDSGFTLSATRPITINAPGGTIDTQTFNPTIVQGITGAGALTKTGSGTLILTGANNYIGGTTIGAGTLQLGNGGATGSIVGNVVDDGTLAFDRSDAVTFPGPISGTGSVTQIGTGSTTLTAANIYSGGTLLAAGTLIAGNNSAFGSGALTVAANAVGTTLDNTAAATSLANAIVLNPLANLTMAGSNGLTLTGPISGDGALTKNGASTLILTADNSYTGGTTINTGTLQVGNGGTTGSIGTGPVLDDAALVFNRSGTVAVPGAIIGTGSLTQEGVGGGTLLLTGDNSYSGGTTIASGVLQLGDGGTTGSIVGDVLNNGALTFDRTDMVTFAGAISGSGAVSQIGLGTTILTGASTYLGGTAIEAGTLQLGNGGTSGSIMGNVLDNGTLVFDRSDALTFVGAISGTGSVTQIGSGSTTLTAANTYEGGTTLSNGTLIAGNNSALGAGTLTVTPNLFGTTTLDNTAAATSLANAIQIDPLANLIVGGSNPLTLTGEISGRGALAKNGASTLILTADNSYAGGTTIGAGTLQLGAGGTTGSIVGDVTDNGTLAFDRSDRVTFPGVISGSGAVSQTGPGTTILTADNTYRRHDDRRRDLAAGQWRHDRRHPRRRDGQWSVGI